MNPLLESLNESVIMDEAHEARNHRTQTFNALTAVKMNIVWAMTGTPIINTAEDLVSLVSCARSAE